MKKAISLILILSLLLCLCACGSEDPAGDVVILPATDNNTPDTPDAPDAEPDAPVTDAPAAEAGFVFTSGNVEIAMNAPVAEILAALGEPKSYTEQTSCAFDGLDKTYFYGSFYLETYPGADGDYVHCVWLVDDSVSTAEGIYIGASQQEVENTYGAENFDGNNVFTMTKGDSTLTIILENGAVSSIQYDAIVE